MASHSKVLNVTRGYEIKYSQAVRGIENCAFAWEIEGKTVRDLTLAEAINKRNEQALLRNEPLPYYEIPGIMYEPTKRNEKQHFAGMEQVWAAHEFARNYEILVYEASKRNKFAKKTILRGSAVA